MKKIIFIIAAAVLLGCSAGTDSADTKKVAGTDSVDSKKARQWKPWDPENMILSS